VNWKLLGDIAGSIGVVVAFILGYLKIRQVRMERKLNLEDNPTRCDRHEGRLAALEVSCAEYKADIGYIKDDIHEIRTDIKELMKRG